MTDLRIGLLSSCNIEFLKKPLAEALELRGIRPRLWVSGFGQYVQDVLNSGSGLYQHDPSIVVLYLDGEDLFRELVEDPFGALPEARLELGLRQAAEVSAMAETLAGRLPRTTLVLNTTAIDPIHSLAGLEYNSEYGLHDAVNAYNAELASVSRRLSNVVIADVASLAASIGFQNWRDSRLWYLARSRWSHRGLQSLSEQYAAVISSRMGGLRKCLVVDLDNTLWGGVVGEDGLPGIRLGEEGIGRAYVEFQLELLNLYRKGILLAICSKNNAADALNVIRHHPAMRLREEHFAGIRMNWEDKASNLRSLAEEMTIGLDSFVFLDDNPVERSWVRQSLPEVLVPDWPEDPSQYKTALLELAARHFCKLSITVEDRQRGEGYQAQAQRRTLASSASSLEEFYQTLQMRAKIGLADPFTVPRIAQLTQKTNQFNLTTRRYIETEIQVIAQDPNYAVWWLDLSDRFGPNGIVGVMILKRAQPGAWAIDTFLLSCRVMGRTVEQAFLAVVSQALGAVRLIGEYRPTAKNGPVRDLYSRLGFGAMGQGPDGEFWDMDLTVTQLESPSWFEIELVPVPASVGARQAAEFASSAERN